MDGCKLNEKGQALIFLALAFVVLGLFLGMSIDLGRGYLLRARLSRVIDAASLAGARNLGQGFIEAKKAACDSAKVNGLNCVDDGGIVKVVPVAAASTTCPSPPCVSVTASSTISTSFMTLAALVGCSTCKILTIAASGIAAPKGFIDLELLMDDTSSMNKGGRVAKAKAGAKTLLDTLIPPDGTSSNQIAMVPFRGCYNPPINDSKCVKTSDIVSLTSDNEAVEDGIDDLEGDGGSGTNICHGLKKGREMLLGGGSGSRPFSKKLLVILTDGDHHPSKPVPQDRDCNFVGGDGDSDRNNLDSEAYSRAKALKDPGGDNIEIFVIDYAAGATAPHPPIPEGVSFSDYCDGELESVPTRSNRNGDDIGDRILALCLASSLGNYFPASNGNAIKAAFEEIARRLGELRLTG
ncbi:MAG: pilus assembly protein TadG-related protein [Deltaproteobacteria bacterium]|nr:pilus assembly protein TadG-related protein [Deltaproteobacteria bacterium]